VRGVFFERMHLTPVAVVLAFAVIAPGVRVSTAQPPAASGGVALKYTPLPPSFKFQTKETVNGWVNSNDVKSMTEHAFELWGALTTLTDQTLNGQKVPVYETWWDRDEALSPANRARLDRPFRRRFEPPRQFAKGKILPKITAMVSGRPVFTLFDNVKYNEEIKDHIQTNMYYSGQTLNTINAGWGNTPLADRKLKDFPDKSVMLKPQYQFVAGNTPTLLGYWAGPAASGTPKTPGSNTWSSLMWVVPPGVDPNSFDHQGRPVVSLDRFHTLNLTADDVATLGNVALSGPPAGTPLPPVGTSFPVNPDGSGGIPTGRKIAAGDAAILVGMHTSTREIDNWTWQTFWWSFTKPELPKKGGGHIKPPFDNYETVVGYSFTTQNNPDAMNILCFNPYLEAGFDESTFNPPRPGQLGIESNCMSCHRCAAWPGNNAFYTANGIIDPGDPTFFTNTTKTDFLWGIPSAVAVPPPGPTPATGR